MLNRLTAKDGDGCYAVAGGDIEKALQKLGVFEDAYEDLMNSQEQIPRELAALRAQGKEKTVWYRETMARKLINNGIAAFFERHGLKG